MFIPDGAGSGKNEACERIGEGWSSRNEMTVLIQKDRHAIGIGQNITSTDGNRKSPTVKTSLKGN